MAFVKQIQLLVGQAIRTQMYYLKGHGSLDPKAYVKAIGPGTYVARDGEISLTSEPARLLQQLYAAATTADRQLFAPTLVKLLNDTNARVVARTLAATGHLNALEQVTKVDSVSEELWRGLIHVLRFESHLFDEADLTTIETAMAGLSARAYADAVARMQQAKRDSKSMPYPLVRVPVGEGPAYTYRPIVPLDEVVEEVRSVVSRVRYLRLGKAIREHQNPAIDADRQILLSRLQSLGFSDSLSNASNEIEQRAVTSSSETDVKSVMDLLRTFYEEFIEEACHKVESKVGKSAPAGPKVNHFAPYRQYLEAQGFIGPEESELLQRLYNFLSNQGTHKLGSVPEQLRVAHATVIEWCMLVAGRINKFLA